MFADIEGARLWYEDGGGKGEPLVLLHAGTGSVGMWLNQTPAFAAAGYRCIAYDRRGYGKTEASGSAIPADDLRALMDFLRLKEFNLLGTAAGGIVALDFALSFPGRVKKLIIANSVGGAQDEDYLALQKRLRPAPQFDALPADFRELGPVYRASNAEGVQRWNEIEHASRKPGTKSMPITRTRITFDALSTLRVPTLLITGDADLYTPPPVLDLFAARIRDSIPVVIPACGHSAYWEQPALFNKAVLDFLKT